VTIAERTVHRRTGPTRSDILQALGFVVLLAVLGLLVVKGAAAMPYRWQWHRVPPYLYRTYEGAFYAGPLLKGLGVTLRISAWGFVVALLAGMAAAGLRLSGSLVGRGIARGYIELIRNTPLLVQLYLFYFVLAPILGIGRDLTGILALGLFEGAFAAEIIRAGILAVPAGQREAAASLGLSPLRGFALVVLPQAFRIALPPLTSLMVSLVKHSAIVSTIAIFDLANEARNAISDTFMTFEIWLTVAALYLLVATVLSLLASLLERRLARGRAPGLA
jgi:polar amino acid transport system permease protein